MSQNLHPKSAKVRCKKCTCDRRYHDGPWSTCENNGCRHSMRDHAIDAAMSKNELIAKIDDTVDQLKRLTKREPQDQQVTAATASLFALRGELDQDKLPTLPEGTWRRVNQAVAVRDQHQPSENYLDIVSDFADIGPDLVR